MGLKDAQTAEVAQWAIDGWMLYVQQVTKHENPLLPVDEKMLYALAGEDLPPWLEDAIRERLVASRTALLIERRSGPASG